MSLLTLLDKPKTTRELHDEYVKDNPSILYSDVFRYMRGYYDLGLVMKHIKKGVITWERIKKDLQFD